MAQDVEQVKKMHSAMLSAAVQDQGIYKKKHVVNLSLLIHEHVYKWEVIRLFIQ